MKVWSASWLSLLYNKGDFSIVLGPEWENLTHTISILVFNTPFLAVVINPGQQGWGCWNGHCMYLLQRPSLP